MMGRFFSVICVIIFAAKTCAASDSFFTWDSDVKSNTVAAVASAANFTFSFTNISSGNITITNVHPSCGCTTVQLPPLPWKIAPNSNGQMVVTVNVAGKGGELSKTILIGTDAGTKILTAKITILPPIVLPLSAEQRTNNVNIALVDRQVVLKNWDCAVCHVHKGLGKVGAELYMADCGICHEGERRASMVPDLHAIKEPTSRKFWIQWITHGKPGTLMPAFGKAEGGPLVDAQVERLVDYINSAFPSKVVEPNLPAR